MSLNFDEMTKEELINYIKKLKREHKYGLVWEEKQEDLDELLKDNYPILENVSSKDILDYDGQPNLFIEGENLHALELLYITHKGSIDVIYIDPPYNTKNKDFKYNDKFVDIDDSYRHSKWISFMHRRLKIARKLLKKDGVLFISIDDNEVSQLKLLCDEIFDEKNFLGMFTWVRKKKGSFLSESVRKMTEYILCYRADKDAKIKFYGEKAYDNKWQPLLKRTNSLKTLELKGNVVEATIPDGIYKKGEYGKGGTMVRLENDIEIKNGKVITPFKVTGRYVWTQEKLDNELKMGTRIAINSLGFGFNVFRWDQSFKIKPPSTLINEDVGVGTNEDANEEIKTIFNISTGDNDLFTYAKPVSLIKYLIKMATYNKKDALILDFFAGSGTTGQAVLELNEEDGGNRRFILVTNNEVDEKTERKLKKMGIEKGSEEFESYGVCRRVTYPRIRKIIKGFYVNKKTKEILDEEKLTVTKLKNIDVILQRMEKIKNEKANEFSKIKYELKNDILKLIGENEEGAFIKGYKVNLKYYQTSLLPKNKNKDQMALQMAKVVDDLLCIKEDCYELVKTHESYRIYKQGNKKIMGVYSDFLNTNIDAFIEDVNSLESHEKIIYSFSFTDGVDSSIFNKLGKETKIEAIPMKILEMFDDLRKRG